MAENILKKMVRFAREKAIDKSDGWANRKGYRVYHMHKVHKHKNKQ